MNSSLLPGAGRYRRRFLGRSLALTAGMCFSLQAPALIVNRDSDRLLAFHNLHTNENLQCRYWSNGRYDPIALGEIDHILRDHRAEEVRNIDPRLLDLIVLVRRNLGTSQPYHVISGYRSAKTNAMLRARSGGVAKNSLHMSGMAIDVRVPGIRLSELRKAGMNLKAGGVGYYPRSNFVHLDIGPHRIW